VSAGAAKLHRKSQIAAASGDIRSCWRSSTTTLANEEHQDRLERLGVDRPGQHDPTRSARSDPVSTIRPGQHDPAHFDIGEINDAFTTLGQNSNSRHRK
jgi:hypothetical protein